MSDLIDNDFSEFSSSKTEHTVISNKGYTPPPQMCCYGKVKFENLDMMWVCKYVALTLDEN